MVIYKDYMNQYKLNKMKITHNSLNQTTLLKRTEKKSTYVKWFPKARSYFRNLQQIKNFELEEKGKRIKMEV